MALKINLYVLILVYGLAGRKIHVTLLILNIFYT